MQVTFEKKTEKGYKLYVQGVAYAADVVVSYGKDPSVRIIASAHMSGVPGLLPRESKAIRQAAKMYVERNFSSPTSIG